MAKRKIYRVEHQESLRGPYQWDSSLEAVPGWWKSLMEMSPPTNGHHLSLSGELSLGDTRERYQKFTNFKDFSFIFGFSSLRKLREWFHKIDREVVDAMSNDDFVISVYMVPEDKYLLLTKQALFYRKKSKLVSRMKMEAVLYGSSGTQSQSS